MDWDAGGIYYLTAQQEHRGPVTVVELTGVKKNFCI